MHTADPCPEYHASRHPTRRRRRRPDSPPGRRDRQGRPRNLRRIGFRGRALCMLSLLALLIWLVPGVAAAESGGEAASDPGGEMPHLVRPGDAKTGSLLFRTPQAGLFREAPRLDTDVSIQVTGMVAQVTVRQGFRNEGGDWLEGVYVFPLPEDSAVNHMEMRVGERIIVGEIQERSQARKTYEKARAEGKRTSLVEQERPNLFTTSVANIGPGETIIVEIRYLQTLAYEEGRFRIRLPLTLTPRFIPGAALPEAEREGTHVVSGNGWAADTTEVADASRITPPQAYDMPETTHMASIRGQVETGFPLQSFASVYHPIRTRQEGDTHVFELDSGKVPMDRDFLLEWTPRVGDAPGAAVFTEQLDGHTYALVMLMPPQARGEVRQPREVIFVIDTSGSMAGTSIIQAREALLLALERLNPGDRFNIIEFDSDFDTLFRSPVEINARSRLLARSWVRGLKANGGTQMAGPLQAALSGSAPEGFLRQVIFITDGSVGNEDALFRIIDAHLAESRLFMVGIGSAPNSHFMRKAAEFGRGTPVYIGEEAEVKTRMEELFRKIQHPLVTDIRATWEGAGEVEMWPQRISDLYHGEPVILTARLERPPARVEISGQSGQTPWHRELRTSGKGRRIEPIASRGGGAEPRHGAVKVPHQNGVGTLWARRKIAVLADRLRRRQQTPEEVRNETLAIALRHRLVTPYTSFVAVDRTPVRPEDQKLKERLLANRMPKGSQQAGFPRSATPAGQRMLIGVALLLAGCLLLLARRRGGVPRALAA